ncbi:hypothetical protein LUZ62_050309 [Rhynchospora pubera]|uniref:Uncharacterized protein n=1 Tax=Rhynchospora pubera TaxID=906938 RepID=A0AAV8G0F8_9POAL|nr:hypothetical protein LUZ62_050309 [Rhynchospora pubera]
MSGGDRKGEEAMDGAGQAGHGAAEVESLVDSFCGVTSASHEEAMFFLESHGWQLDPAIESFYEDMPLEVEGENAEEDEGDGEEREGEEADSDDEDYVPSENEDAGNTNAAVARSSVAVRVSESGSRRKEKAGKSGRRLAFTTFSDLKRKAESDSDCDTDSDEDQDYYAGGEKSGMLVRDSSRKRSRNDAEAIFEQARKFARPGPSKSKSKSFTGKGRVLSSEEAPSPGAQQTQNISYNIYFWRNGFTVNNGPLRGFDDPENAAFLESMKKSECPKELKPSDESSEVHVNLVHKQINYPTQTPQPPHKKSMRKGTFRGTGRTLGADPLPVSDTTADVPVPAPTPPSNQKPSPIPGFQVDESLPTTSLQIRLADGTRLVARFNTNNTIRDLRAFIDASRPNGTGTGTARSYRLQMVGFPPKLLDDGNKTIEEEGIANSVVIQKI